jgi:hypothetical protein
MSLSGDNILHYMWDIIKVYVPLLSQSAAESWQVGRQPCHIESGQTLDNTRVDGKSK